MKTTEYYSEFKKMLSDSNEKAEYIKIQNRLSKEGITVSLEEIELNATYVSQGIAEDREGDLLSDDWCAEYFYDAVQESVRLSLW